MDLNLNQDTPLNIGNVPANMLSYVFKPGVSRLKKVAPLNFLERLPKDVLLKISRYVHSQSCFRSWSKYWPRLRSTSLSWIPLDTDVFVTGASFGSRELHALVSKHQRLLVHLDITSCCSLEAKDLARALDGAVHLEKIVLAENLCLQGGDGFFEVLGRLPKLHTIDASGCHNIDDTAIKHISQSRSIQKLVLDKCDISDEGLKHIPSQVTFLSFRMCKKKITSQGIQNLMQKLPGLQHLLLDQCSGIETFNVFERLATSWSTHLFHLDIGFVFDLNDLNLRYISRLRSLKTLKFCGGNVTTEGLFALKNLIKLEKLTMFRLDRADLDVLPYLSKNVQNLYVYGCRKATEKCLWGILKLINLAEIVLSHNFTIQDVSFIVGSNVLPRLRFLQISNFYNLSKPCILQMETLSRERPQQLELVFRPSIHHLAVRD